MLPKIKRTKGPTKKICDIRAMGKLNATVLSHTATISVPGFLKSITAIRLMIGHITQTVRADINNIINIEFSITGVIILFANFIVILSPIRNSIKIAAGHIIIIS
jgi:hypothetical protein